MNILMWFKYCSKMFLMGSIYDLPLGIFQKIFLILYMCVCLWVSICAGALEVQKKVTVDSLSWSYRRL